MERPDETKSCERYRKWMECRYGNKLTGGTIVAANAIYLGNTSFALNAASRNLVVKDAQSTPQSRVIVGQNGSQTTDYGIWVYDASGSLILGASGLGTNIVGTGQISNGAVTNDKITSVEANKITVNSARIRAAQIEDLVVGSNVTMGPNASISWSKVTSKPFIPQTAGDVGAVTNNQQAVFNTLTNNGNIRGLFMNSGNLYINADYINGGTITGVNINVGTDLTVGDNIYVGNLSSSNEKRIYLKQLAYMFSKGDSIGLTSVADIYLSPGGGNAYIGESATEANRIATISDLTNGNVVAVFG